MQASVRSVKQKINVDWKAGSSEGGMEGREGKEDKAKMRKDKRERMIEGKKIKLRKNTHENAPAKISQADQEPAQSRLRVEYSSD